MGALAINFCKIVGKHSFHIKSSLPAGLYATLGKGIGVPVIRAEALSNIAGILKSVNIPV